MTNEEWLAYLDRLAAIEQPTGADVAECLGAMMERLNTILLSYANRQLDDIQRLERRTTRPREREAGE